MACKLSAWSILATCILFGTTSAQLYLPEPIQYDAFPYSNRTFLIYFKSLATYDDAQKVCKQQGGNLAKIDSSQYNTQLTNEVYTHTSNYWMRGTSTHYQDNNPRYAGVYSFWSGAKWDRSKQNYVYADKQVARYTNWLSAFGEPSYNGDCVEIFLDNSIHFDSSSPYRNDNNNVPIIGQWSTTKCADEVRPFVCECFKSPRYTPHRSIPSEPSSINRGNKTYLFFVQNVKNTTNAMATCKEHNATVVKIENDDDFWFIGNHTRKLVIDYWRGNAPSSIPLPFNTYWYGVVAYKDAYDRKWVYSDSAPVAYLYGFEGGEADVPYANQQWGWYYDNNMYCISASLHPSYSLNYVQSRDYYQYPGGGCDSKMPFVCEKPFINNTTGNTSLVHQLLNASSSINKTLSLLDDIFHGNGSANYTIVTNSTFTETTNHYQLEPKENHTSGINVSNAVLLWVLIAIGGMVLLLSVCTSSLCCFTIIHWRKNRTSRDNRDVSPV